MAVLSTLHRLPNLVNAGVTKAGTSSLWGYLGQHPDVCPADTKDVDHLSTWRFGEPHGPLEEYAAHFSHCEGQRYRFDASPDYFTGGLPLARALDDALPDARIVITLRDPLKRLWSSYTYKKSRGALPADATFREVFEADLAAFRSGADETREGQHHRTLSTGAYALHLPAWFEVFGDRVHLVFVEHLAADAEAEMRRLFTWLDIDPAVAETLDYDVRNPTVMPRSHGLRRLAERVNEVGEDVFRRAPAVERAMRRAYAAINGRPPQERLRDEDRVAVEAFYAPYTAQLAPMLRDAGVDRLPEWVS